jgi:hypothetical protein
MADPPPRVHRQTLYLFSLTQHPNKRETAQTSRKSSHKPNFARFVDFEDSEKLGKMLQGYPHIDVGYGRTLRKR